jgi:hypothetical protein
MIGEQDHIPRLSKGATEINWGDFIAIVNPLKKHRALKAKTSIHFRTYVLKQITN